MPIDIRYHAVSLLAVFLALVLGILVGFAMVDPTQMQEFVDMVKKDNERTRTENREELEALREKEGISAAFENSLLPYIIEDRLANRRVAIVLDYVPQHDSPAPMLREVLEKAGASVTAALSLDPKFGRLEEEEAAQVVEELDLETPPEQNLRTFLAERLGESIADGGSDLPFRLEKEALLQIAPRSSFDRAVDAVVVVGNTAQPQEFLDSVEEPLLRTLQEQGRRIVGCELSGDAGDAVQFYQRLDCSTVDCVDTYPGQVALVLVLAGEDGRFGTKPTADRLLPELE